MNLTQEELDILNGSKGEAMAKVMKTLVLYGEAFGEQETGWKNITEARENKALFVLDTVGNRAIFCKNLTIHASTAEMQEQILEMMHASAEGRLFIRERETGMLMQLNTSQLDKMVSSWSSPHSSVRFPVSMLPSWIW